MTTMTMQQALEELAQRHRALYASSEIDARLKTIIRAGPHARLTDGDILHILRSARSVFFDTHVEVVSGHHTATYLRFESIARFPDLIQRIVDDMAGWIRRTFPHEAVTGVLATASAAQQLAQGVADRLREMAPLRVTLTPYSGETGKIGTEITVGAVAPEDRVLALNDVTTRGNCVSKLGKVITDNGGRLIGMMVFARRDSGQFPLLNDLIGQYPFYYATDLDMPQWEPAQCPLCLDNKPLLSWKDMPEL
jgi:orotate phosphoribosyltransferase